MSDQDISESVMQHLFYEGNFSHILCRIFGYLNGPSLEMCSMVSRDWNSFIRVHILGKDPINWKDVIPKSVQYQLSKGRAFAMKANLTEILIGFEDGSMEFKSRIDSNKNLTPPMVGHSHLIRSIDLGVKYLASGSWDQSVKIWNKVTGKCLMTSFHHTRPVTGVILQEDDAILYTSSMDGWVKKLSIDPGEIHILKLDKNFNLKHEESVIDMVCEDHRLLTGCSDARLFLWNTATQELLRIFSGHKSGVRSVFMRGHILASGAKDHFVKIWNTKDPTSECVRTLDHDYDVRCVSFNSAILLSSDERSDVYMWNMEAILNTKHYTKQSNLLLNVVTGHNGFVHSIHFTPTCLLSCDVTGLIYERDAFDCVRERPGFRIIKCPDGIHCMACDQDHVICGLLDKTIRVLRRCDKSLVASLSGHTEPIWSLDHDKRILVSGSWDATVRIWHKKDWSHLFTFLHPDSREISGVKIHRGTVYVGCLNGSVAVIVEDAKEHFMLKQIVHTSSLGGIYALDIQCQRLITAHAKLCPSVQEWEILSDGQVKPVQMLNEKSQSESIIWSIHLAYPLALFCHDNEMLDIYHLETDSCLRTLRHVSKVMDAKLHKGLLIVGCQYGYLAFWDLTSTLESSRLVLDMEQDALFCLNEHSAAIGSVFVDDEEVITTDYDGIIAMRKISRNTNLQQFVDRTRNIKTITSSTRNFKEN